MPDDGGMSEHVGVLMHLLVFYEDIDQNAWSSH
jgi:hypothetical protein